MTKNISILPKVPVFDSNTEAVKHFFYLRGTIGEATYNFDTVTVTVRFAIMFYAVLGHAYNFCLRKILLHVSKARVMNVDNANCLKDMRPYDVFIQSD